MRNKGFPNSLVIIIILISLIVWVIGFKGWRELTPEEKNFLQAEQKSTPVPTSSPNKASYQDFFFDIPANWITYATGDNMDLNKEFLKNNQSIKFPKLSIKYPASWRVKKREDLSYMYKKEEASGDFDLQKIHPKNGDTYAIEGLLEDNAGITFDIGVVPKGVSDFDSIFWGSGYVHYGGERWVMINGYPAEQAYYMKWDLYPRGTLFFLKDNVQVNIESRFENTEYDKCESEYCKITTDEINRILSSITFTYP